METGVLALCEKLGPILLRHPASLRYDDGTMESFLSQLPHDSDKLTDMARDHDNTIAKAVVKADRKRTAEPR